jgi:hypothetical protein
MLSKIGRVPESGEIWTDRTFQHNSGSWQNFAMTSPETLHMKNAVTNTAFHWLLIRPVSTHGLVAMDF